MSGFEEEKDKGIVNNEDNNNNNKVEFGSSEEFVVKRLRSCLPCAVFVGLLNSLFVIFLLLLFVEIPYFIIGEDIIKIIIDSLNEAGLISLEYNVFLRGLGILTLIAVGLYVSYKALLASDKELLLEKDKVIFKNKFLRKEKVFSYTDIVRVRYDPFLFNIGKIIIETYNVNEALVIDFIPSLKKNFDEVKRIILDNMKVEVSNKIRSVNEEVSDTSVDSVVELLRKESVDKDDVVRTLVSISKQEGVGEKKGGKDIFRIVLSELFRTRRIGRDTIKEVLEELREKGLLTEEDLPEITKLLFEMEEARLGF